MNGVHVAVRRLKWAVDTKEGRWRSFIGVLGVLADMMFMYLYVGTAQSGGCWCDDELLEGLDPIPGRSIDVLFG